MSRLSLSLRRCPCLPFHSIPMAFYHRKLLNESAVDTTIDSLCHKYCDPEKNLDEICPFTCIDLCPPVCKISLLDIPPPLPPVVFSSSPSEKSHRLSLILTISLAVLSAAFFFFICYTIYKFYSNLYSSRRRRRSQPQEDGGADDFLDEDQGPVVDHPIWYIRTIGLQPSVIGLITIVKYKRGDGLIDGTDCSVCLNEFQEDETVRLLPKCNHAFHVACIDTWLRSHTNCPMCRAGILNNPAGLLTEQNFQNSGLGPAEEAQNETSRSNREVGRELETEPPEFRIGIEDDTVTRAEDRLKADDESLSDPGGSDGIQPLRRSISADSLSAIVSAFPWQSGQTNSDNRLVEVKESTSGVAGKSKRAGINQSLLRLIRSPSIERYGQTERSASSMKRSLSWSANVLLSRRHSSKNRN